jgi:hypothetical protein
MDRFSQDALQYHNFLRFKHNAPPLSHSTALQNSAQNWAEQLLKFNHVDGSPQSKAAEVGESICRKHGTTTMEGASVAGDLVSNITAKEAVEYWYMDSKKYNFREGTGDAGSFTQLVWKRTREVGFGVARNAEQCIVVAHYSPPGNVSDRRCLECTHNVTKCCSLLQSI